MFDGSERVWFYENIKRSTSYTNNQEQEYKQVTVVNAHVALTWEWTWLDASFKRTSYLQHGRLTINFVPADKPDCANNINSKSRLHITTVINDRLYSVYSLLIINVLSTKQSNDKTKYIGRVMRFTPREITRLEIE